MHCKIWFQDAKTYSVDGHEKCRQLQEWPAAACVRKDPQGQLFVDTTLSYVGYLEKPIGRSLGASAKSCLTESAATADL